MQIGIDIGSESDSGRLFWQCRFILMVFYLSNCFIIFDTLNEHYVNQVNWLNVSTQTKYQVYLWCAACSVAGL